MCPNKVFTKWCELKDGKTAGPDGLTENDLSMDMNNTAAILTLIFQTVVLCQISRRWLMWCLFLKREIGKVPEIIDQFS